MKRKGVQLPIKAIAVVMGILVAKFLLFFFFKGALGKRLTWMRVGLWAECGKGITAPDEQEGLFRLYWLL